jgi:hypothetical protein
MILVLSLLTACGGGGGVDVNIEGNNWPWPWPGDADVYVDKTFSEVVTVEDHTRIRLDTVNGEVEISGRPDASSVTVTAELEVGSDSYEDAQEGLDQLEVHLADRSDEIFVQTLHPQNTQGRQYVVDFAITVPGDLAVVVNHVNGHVSVEEIENAISVDVHNGNVILSNINGDSTVSVVNGSVDGTITLPPNGEIRLSTVNGDLDLRIPTSTSAELSAKVDNGTITWGNLDLMDTRDTNQSLTGRLGDGTGLIELETRNGNIDVVGFNG